MEQQTEKKGFSGQQVLALIIGTILIVAAGTYFVVTSFLYPQPFVPVQLSQKEQQQLEQKLTRLENAAPEQTPQRDREGRLIPEPYTEDQAARTIRFSERELNSLLFSNTEMAESVALDLAKNLISIKMIIPVDPDFPVLGGQNLKIKAGAEIAYNNNKPVVIFRGLSIMGVPLPKAWLGDFKNVDLVEEFGTEQGFWQGFSEGVEALQVGDSYLQITLKE